MDDRTRYIYGLVDPRDGRVRYVGMTTSPELRLVSHCTNLGRLQPDGQLARRGRKDDWLRELEAGGLRPQMTVFEEVAPENDPLVREEVWIDRMRAGGADLLNGRPAGRPDPSELAAFRVARGWSQHDLARHLGLSSGAVSLWEAGKRTPPRLVRLALERLAQLHPPT